MIFGILLIIMPFLGFPGSWDTAFYVVVGLLIVAVAYSLAPKQDLSKKNDAKSLPFTEHQNFRETKKAETKEKDDKDPAKRPAVDEISKNTSTIGK